MKRLAIAAGVIVLLVASVQAAKVIRPLVHRAPLPTGKILRIDNASFILRLDGVSKICRLGGC